jgi:hypothetical protein
MAKIDKEKVKKVADDVMQSKAVNYVIPSDHKKIRQGQVVTTPLDIEEALQRQRLIRMGIVAPLMVYPFFQPAFGKKYTYALLLGGIFIAYTSYKNYTHTGITV